MNIKLSESQALRTFNLDDSYVLEYFVILRNEITEHSLREPLEMDEIQYYISTSLSSLCKVRVFHQNNWDISHMCLRNVDNGERLVPISWQLNGNLFYSFKKDEHHSLEIAQIINGIVSYVELPNDSFTFKTNLLEDIPQKVSDKLLRMYWSSRILPHLNQTNLIPIIITLIQSYIFFSTKQ